MSLETLGWTSFFDHNFQEHSARRLLPARVVAESRELYRLLTPEGEGWGEPTGALRYRAESRLDLPAVGDWVAMERFPGSHSIVHAVLPRRTLLSRRAAGRRSEVQIVGANLDTVFVVTSLNLDLNLRRLERSLALVEGTGVRAVIVLSKLDLVAIPDLAFQSVEAVAGAVPVHALSALSGEGLEALTPYLEPGQTVALLGSSGVGKSTLVNRLLRENRQVVREIREGDDRGRHATTARELFPLPSGALLLDTPGMRELGLTGDGEGLEEAFADIAALAETCRFTDCRHGGEPGCAVAQALADGRLDPERKASYDKLRNEEAWIADRLEGGAAFAEKKRWKTIHQRLKQQGFKDGARMKPRP